MSRTRTGNVSRRARQLQHEHDMKYTEALRMAKAEAAALATDPASPSSGGSGGGSGGGSPIGGGSAGWPVSVIAAVVEAYVLDHVQYTNLDVDLVDDRPRGLRIQGWDLPAAFAASQLEDLQLEQEASAVWTPGAGRAGTVVGTYTVSATAVVEGFPDKSSWDLPDVDDRIQVSDNDHNSHMMRAEAWVLVVATFDIGVDALGDPAVLDMQLAIPDPPTTAGGTGGTGGSSGPAGPGQFNPDEATRETAVWHAQSLDGNDLPSPAAASLLERHGISPGGLEVMVTGVVVDPLSVQVDRVDSFTGDDLYNLEVSATVTTSVYLPPAVADQVLQQDGVRLDFREDPHGVQVLLPSAEVLVEGTALVSPDDVTDSERTSVSLVDAP